MNTPLPPEEDDAVSRRLGDLLRAHVPRDIEPPFPDFFNSQVLKKIRDEESAAAAVPAPLRWFGWLRSPLMAGACAAGFTALALISFHQSAEAGTRVVTNYSPEPNVTATTSYNRAAGATVIMLDGLDAFPDDRLVTAWNAASEPALQVAGIR